MIVRVCASACQGAQPGAGGQTHSHLRPEPEAGHLAIDKCKTIDVGVTLPRQTDHYYNEKLKKYRDGTPDHLRDGSLHPVQAAPRSSTLMLKSSRSGPPCHRAHGCEGQRASDETDPTRSSREPGHRRLALRLLLTREAPEQKEPNRLLTDTGESSEHPAHPTAPGQRGTQQAQVSHDCPSAHVTTERHTIGE